MRKNIIYIIALLIVTAYLIFFAITHPMYVLDCIFAYIAISLFFLLERRFPLKTWLFVLGIVPFIVELSGLAFGFFSFSIYGFGFDKMLHFMNSFIITTIIYFWISSDYKKHKSIKIALVILVVLGIGALGEITEFLGQRYFHIYGPGAFSQGDLLPSTLNNDLKNYDTWWDMILNVIGSLTAGTVLAFSKKTH